MRNLIIVLTLFLAACSSDPTQDITPLIERNLSLNNGLWEYGTISFVAQDEIIKDISWGWGGTANVGHTHAHKYSFDTTSDTLRINLRSNGPDGAVSWLDFALDWQLGKDIVYGIQSLKGGIGASKIQFTKYVSN